MFSEPQSRQFFSTTIIQVYAIRTDTEEDMVDYFNGQIQCEIDITCKQEVLLGMPKLETFYIKKENVVGLYGLGNQNETRD